MEPLVSIITPLYNSGKFVAQTIESVLNQTYDNWEMLIVDDNSKDNGVEIVKKYMANDNRIKLFSFDKSKGAAIARNYAIIQAQGKYVAFLDSDDLWLPNKLKHQVAFMEENKYNFSYTNYAKIDEDGNSLNRVRHCIPKVTYKKILRRCYVGCLTVMYNQEHVGKFQIADLKKCNDNAMWFKILQKTDGYLLNETLGEYRIRSGSISSGSKFKLIKHNYILFKKGAEFGFIKSLYFTFLNIMYYVFDRNK